MKTGTKSLLFGVHQFILHPLFVLAGWVKLYGWSVKKVSCAYVWWKVVLCIFAHDLGYYNCDDMDGEWSGAMRPEFGAKLIHKYVDEKSGFIYMYQNLCLYHSASYARRFGGSPSDLCYADKLGSVLIPWWLWVGLGKLSGELAEYRANPEFNKRLAIQPEYTNRQYFEAYRRLVYGVLRDREFTGP
jgi:hypothetical protein